MLFILSSIRIWPFGALWIKGAQFLMVDQGTPKSIVCSKSQTPPTFLPLIVGGLGSELVVFSTWAPHNVPNPYLIIPPSLNSAYHLPPPLIIFLATHQYRPPHSATVHHYLVTHHTHLPVGQLMPPTVTIIRPTDHLFHNRHPSTLFNPVSSPLSHCSLIQT